jgi:SAM-dependent methyltransferase
VDPQHWNRRYESAPPTALSWYESKPALSLEFIRSRSHPRDAILDVGAGASSLVDGLLAAGYLKVSLLDISKSALEATRLRLGARSEGVQFFVADVARWTAPQMYDVWHDRTAFHFMIEERERAGYKLALLSGLRPGGTFIVATYAHGAPDQCSGLPVRRYNRSELEDFLGDEFICLEVLESDHETPGGKRLPLHWGVFERRLD